MVHVVKASGKLFELCDDCDHDRATADDVELREKYAKYLADLVLCSTTIDLYTSERGFGFFCIHFDSHRIITLH